MAVRGVGGVGGSGANPNVSTAVGILPVANGGTGNALGTVTPAFANPVTSNLVTTQNNYPLAAGINKMRLTAAAGDTTMNGLSATNAVEGTTVYIRNQSTTDNLILAHMAAGQAAGNQFNCAQGVNAVLPPGTGTLVIYDATAAVWDVGA